jgi:anti-sigma regulatory factor (Ser/Thr protein kinase)
VADWPLTSDLGPLGALPTVPRLARGFVSVTLNGWGLDVLTDVTELLVSELSTNVVRASMNPDGTVRYDDDGKLPLLWIRLLFDHDRLMIEVWDTLPASLGAPVARHPDPDEESGRGLEIIEMLAEDWGWETVPGWAGKKVWAILKVVQLSQRSWRQGASRSSKQGECRPAPLATARWRLRALLSRPSAPTRRRGRLGAR